MSLQTTNGLPLVAQAKRGGVLSNTDTMDEIFINNRVCPMPHQWHRVWKKIKSKTHKYISMPLILTDWFNSSDNEKRERFEYHLNMAKKLKVFEEVKLYLNSLNELDWFHKTE